jgi:hypothetical protein
VLFWLVDRATRVPSENSKVFANRLNILSALPRSRETFRNGGNSQALPDAMRASDSAADRTA